MVSFSIAVAPFSVIYQAINISSRRNTSACLPGVWTESGAHFHLLRDQRKKCRLIDNFDDFCPVLTVPAEDPDDRLLRSTSASFRNRFVQQLNLHFVPSETDGLSPPILRRKTERQGMWEKVIFASGIPSPARTHFKYLLSITFWAGDFYLFSGLKSLLDLGDK